MADVVKALGPLVEIVNEPVRVPATATKIDIGWPPAQKVPQ